MVVTEVIRKRINDLGMTSKAVAEKAKISPQNLSASLNGRRRLMASDLINLCQVLNLSLDDFRVEH